MHNVLNNQILMEMSVNTFVWEKLDFRREKTLSFKCLFAPTILIAKWESVKTLQDATKSQINCFASN